MSITYDYDPHPQQIPHFLRSFMGPGTAVTLQAKEQFRKTDFFFSLPKQYNKKIARFPIK